MQVDFNEPLVLNTDTAIILHKRNKPNPAAPSHHHTVIKNYLNVILERDNLVNSCSPTSGYPNFVPQGYLALGEGDADSIGSEVVDCVVLAEESITEDSQGTNRSGHIHTHKGRQAAARSLQDVVLGAEGKVVASKRERYFLEARLLAAVDGELTVPALLGTDLSVQHLSELAGESDERGTGVEDNTVALKVRNIIAIANGIEVHLPVGLAAERDLGDLASVLLIVDTAKHNLGLAVLVSEIEREDGLINELLLNHLVERRGDAIHSDPRVAETENAIKATKGESQAGLAGSLGKELVVDGNVTNGHSVLRDEAAETTRAILNLKARAVLLVCRRLGRLVLVVEVAGDGAALGGGNPEVGAAGIQNYLEGLGWRSEGDLGEVYQTLVTVSMPTYTSHQSRFNAYTERS